MTDRGGEWVLGVLGGSGVYEIEGLENREWRRIETPWGAPSDELLFGEIGGVRLVFLPRHGRGHRFTPTTVNARANIAALKLAGCTDVLALSAVGSLREELPPGTFVVVDQYVDRTFAREKTFFDTGVVGHVSMAQPVDARLAGLAAEAGREAGATVVGGGTLLVMEGPQFSTQAESRLYQAWGCSVIGMTAMPEAKLAREAELPYASVCMVTDYDAWSEAHDHVDVSQVVATMNQNAAKARELVKRMAGLLTGVRAPVPADTALDGAVMTAPSVRDPELLARLRVLSPRAFGR